MAIQTLVDLRVRLKDWSNRKDLADTLLTDFINVAQARANRLLDIPPFDKVGSKTLDANSRVVVPKDFIEAKVFSIVIGNITIELERKNPAFVLKDKSVSIYPTYFTRIGGEFLISPAMPEGTEVSLYYTAALTPLALDTDSNWLVTDAPEVLLYGALSELSLYTKNLEEASLWEGKFQSAMVELQNMNDTAEWSGSSIAIGGVS